MICIKFYLQHNFIIPTSLAYVCFTLRLGYHWYWQSTKPLSRNTHQQIVKVRVKPTVYICRWHTDEPLFEMVSSNCQGLWQLTTCILDTRNAKILAEYILQIKYGPFLYTQSPNFQYLSCIRPCRLSIWLITKMFLFFFLMPDTKRWCC
jgi:hypothetical protein